MAHEYDPELGIPLAGLGDVVIEQGRYQEAIKWYERFLEFLANEKRDGDPQGLGIYEEECKTKHDRANLKLKILTDSMSSVVPKEILTRGLQVIPPKEEYEKRIETERLPLFIYFASSGAVVEKPVTPWRGASILVESNVRGASVFVDGRNVGVTPLSNISISIGRHSVLVEKSGYATYQKRVKVDPGRSV